jgi:hypothetical protein
MNEPILIDQGAPLVPFDAAPAGCKLACNVVIGERPDGSFALELRLPSGVAFVVDNAQQLVALAMQTREAATVRQTHEIITAASLPRS